MELILTTTPRELLDLHIWDKACEVLGINEWALNEGLMDSDEKIQLNYEQAKQLGLLK